MTRVSGASASQKTDRSPLEGRYRAVGGSRALRLTLLYSRPERSVMGAVRLRGRQVRPLLDNQTESAAAHHSLRWHLVQRPQFAWHHQDTFQEDSRACI